MVTQDNIPVFAFDGEEVIHDGPLVPLGEIGALVQRSGNQVLPLQRVNEAVGGDIELASSALLPPPHPTQ